MVPVRLVGFSEEREIRLAAFLARRGVLAEGGDGPEAAGRPEPLLALLDAGAREAVLAALDAWGGQPPAHPVAALFAAEGLPLLDAGLFPRWVECVACPRLEEYLAQTLGVATRPPGPPVAAAACSVAGGGDFIARIHVLGPAGAVFDAPGPCRGGDLVTFRFRPPNRPPLTVPGRVLAARARLQGGWRCVASFGAASPARRRALCRVLADEP